MSGNDSDSSPPIRLQWDMVRGRTTKGPTAAEVASRYFAKARAASKQAFAEEVARIFLGEPNLRRLELDLRFESEYDDQGGYFKAPLLFAKGRFDGLPVSALVGPCESYDPQLVQEDNMTLEDAVDLWNDVCRDVLEPETYWLNEPDLWACELCATRAGLEGATHIGVVDLAAFWLHLAEAVGSDRSQEAAPLSDVAA
jgi:hypothetical protein